MIIQVPIPAQITAGGHQGMTTTTWLWDEADPLAVSIAFTDENVWTVGRDLLATGMTEPTGDGDICVAPVPGYGSVQLTLQPTAEGEPAWTADIRLASLAVSTFLTATFQRVPMGSETIPDDEYDRLLLDV